MEVLYRRKGNSFRIPDLRSADHARSSSFTGPPHEGRMHQKANLKAVCLIAALTLMPRFNDSWSSNRITSKDIHTACVYPKTDSSKTKLKHDRPISTNGGKGAAKKGLRQEEHTIVYTSTEVPRKLPSETHLHKQPIKIDIVNPSEKLDPLSRLNLGKLYPVEHNVRVCEVGQVRGEHKRILLHYYRTEMQKQFQS